MRKPKAGKYINLTKAKNKYRLTDAEVKTLHCEFEENPVDPAFAPMRMYEEIEVYELAMRKWGSASGMADAQLASPAQVAAATREHNKKMRAAAKAAERRQVEENRQRLERETHVRSRLGAWGLPANRATFDSTLCDYITFGTGSDRIENRISTLRADLDRKQAAERKRRAAVAAALPAHGYPASVADDAYFKEFIKYGNLEDAAVRAAAYAGERHRKSMITLACSQAGLPDGVGDYVFGAYIHSGQGFDAAFGDFRARMQQAQAAAQQAQQRRLARMRPEAQQVMLNWQAGPPPVGWVPEFGKKCGLACVYTGCVNTCPIACAYGLCNAHRQHCRDSNCPKHGVAAPQRYYVK